ncbi:MAG: mannitol dehydrogenase family protein, partial [Treponema sp.]|nr:mannitol dehydrogenase family protein [Treponema sp.]
MLELTLRCLKEQRAEFEEAGIRVPAFDIEAVRDRTRAAPVWVHIGSGNLFKGYHAALAQRIIEGGFDNRGIIAVEPFDHEIVRRVYEPHDNLGIRVVMKTGGDLDMELVASVTEALATDWERIKAIFR